MLSLRVRKRLILSQNCFLKTVDSYWIPRYRNSLRVISRFIAQASALGGASRIQTWIPARSHCQCCLGFWSQMSNVSVLLVSRCLSVAECLCLSWLSELVSKNQCLALERGFYGRVQHRWYKKVLCLFLAHLFNIWYLSHERILIFANGVCILRL